MTEKKFLNKDELSRFLGIAKNTINFWLQKGYIPSYKIGRRRVFDKDEIIAWVKEHKTIKSQKRRRPKKAKTS